MTTEPLYVRGAFVGYSPNSSKIIDQPPHIIPFRFNPESLSRALSFQGGSNPANATADNKVDGPQGTADSSQQKSGNVPADKAGGFRETLSLKLRFDVHERDQLTRLLPPALGVAPELAALELLMHPAEEEKPVRPGVDVESLRPTVLLVWGPRLMPVRVASMQIEEALHNAFLQPVRAEVTVSLEMLPTYGQDDVVQAAHRYMRIKRIGLARLFHATAAAQGSILPL